MSREDFRFVHPLRVRWAEVDRQGIVFNSHYLTYLDVAMTEYCRAIGYPYPEGLTEGGSDLFVAHAELDYHGSAAFDDDLEIAARIARIGRSSLHFLFEIFRGDDHLITGRLVYVNADPETRRSAPVPESIRAAVRDFERVPPEGSEAG